MGRFGERRSGIVYLLVQGVSKAHILVGDACEMGGRVLCYSWRRLAAVRGSEGVGICVLQGYGFHVVGGEFLTVGYHAVGGLGDQIVVSIGYVKVESTACRRRKVNRRE